MRDADRSRIIERIPLQAMLLWPSIIIITLSVAFTTIMLQFNAREAVYNLAVRTSREMDARIEEHLRSYLSLPHAINQINFDILSRGVIKPDDLASVQRLIIKQVRQFPNVNAITYADEKKEFLCAYRPEASHGVELYISGKSSGFDMVRYSLDAEDHPVRELERFPDYDPRPRIWFRTAVENHGPAWTPVFTWTNGDIGLDAVRSVRAGPALPAVVLDVSLTLSGINQYLRQLPFSSAGVAFIIERSGLLIATSASEASFLRTKDAIQRRSARQSGVSLIRDTYGELTRSSPDLLAVTAQQFTAMDLPGGRCFVEVNPYRDAQGLDWLTFVVLPELDLIPQYAANSRIIMAVIGLLIAVAVLINFRMSRWISRPILHLNASARLVAGGNLDQVIDLRRRDEIGQLARSFNDMARKLKSDFLTLQEGEEKYRSLFMSTGTAMAIVENDMTISLVNARFEELSGLSRTEIEGRRSILDFADAPFSSLLQQYHERRREPGGDAPPQYEFDFKDHSGVIKHVIMTVSLVPGSTRSIASLIDISDRRRAEEALEESLRKLRQTQEQLLQSQKMEAVGRLAGGVAHDFNNMLTSILGYGELLLNDLLTGDARRAALEQIMKAGNSAALLTRQLLAFSRKQVLQPRVLDLNALVEETIGLLRPLIGEDIHLERQFAPGPLLVCADPTQLQQVIINLAVNSREAMPGGGVIVLTTTSAPAAQLPPGFEGLAPAEYCLLTVRDTGVGMDRETLERLYEPFFTTKGQGKGTGLGLSTAYGIVTQSGGRIVCSSAPGTGTAFTVCLPRQSPVEKEEREIPPLAGIRGGSETILVVEDEDSVRELIQSVLTSAGYTVRAVRTGTEGLQVFESSPEPIHLVLTDLLLPGGLSGLDLARRVSASPRGARLLVVSGYHGNLSSAAIEALPPGSFLQKPVTPTMLLNRVRAIFDAR